MGSSENKPSHMVVIADVRGLLADDSLINDSAPSTFREWNTDQMLQVKSPNGSHEVRMTPAFFLGVSSPLFERSHKPPRFSSLNTER